jgi:hypothetical protein
MADQRPARTASGTPIRWRGLATAATLTAVTATLIAVTVLPTAASGRGPAVTGDPTARGLPGTAGSYRVAVTTEQGITSQGGHYTVTVPRLIGPNASVVTRVNQSIDAYLTAEKNDTGQDTTLSLTAGTIHVGGHVLSVPFDGLRTTRGTAHPTKLAAGLVFDLRTGARIRISDVFSSTPAGLRRLQSAVTTELTRRLGHTPDPTLTAPTVANYDQFVVSPNGLTVIVADLPFVFGPQNVTVPWTQLSDLVRPSRLPVLRS